MVNHKKHAQPFAKTFAYLRTSSAANVGEDKDSAQRQRAAIDAWAKPAGVEIVAEYRDEAVRGADPVDARPGFAAMLAAIAGNGVRTIVVETASRFARDLMTQEAGHAMLRDAGIDLIAADSPTAFLDDSPTAVLIRQLLGAVAQFEKAMLVAKLRGARERKARLLGVKTITGRKSVAELAPEAVELARRMARRRKRQLSLREIAAELAAAGHLTRHGQPYSATSIARMLGRA
jgi:DNA invertase Pin-like site-specific DNA recombinase